MSFLRPSDDPAVAIAQLAEWLEADEPEPLLIETSGSSGQPKRVVLSRDAVVASVEASAQRLGARGPWLLALPSAYVAGVQVICRSLLAGHEPVVVDGLDFARADTQGRFTSLVPTQLHRLVQDEEQVEALRGLHTILLGGGPIEPSLRQRAEGAGLRIVATYGSSETAGGCVYDGLPLDGVRLAVDSDGRLRIGGPTVFDGYDGDPALTGECLVDGWFLTSDAGRVDDDGRLHVLGRIDDVVISGGVNVPLPAVARRLREHPDIEAVEVLGIPDEEWGTRVVAFVVGTDRGPAGLGRRGALTHVGAAAGRPAARAAAAAQRQGRPPGAQEPDVMHVFSIPLRTRFRGITVREGVLIEGTAGWGEWSPFLDYDEEVSRPWLRCALEAAAGDWPTPVRDAVPVNVTVPACSPERAHQIVRAGGCTTAKVKVAERGQSLADDLARLEAVRDALGPAGLIRVDANGGWDLDEAVVAIREIGRAAGGLEYVEQPCASVEDLAAVRRRVDVPIAADESIRRAEDPYRVRDLEAADIAVLKVQPLGGVRACLRIAEDIGLPVVVSSAVESSVGIAAGVALAAALPEPRRTPAAWPRSSC